MIVQYSYGQDDIHTNDKNVIDFYKSWKDAEIRADLESKRTELVSIFINTQNNLNCACSIRSNNAFLGKEVYMVGRKRYDRRGTVGCGHYERVFHADTFDEVYNKLDALGYKFYAIDNIMEYHPVNLFDVKFPEKTALVFGEEGPGLSKEIIDKCNEMIYINTIGSVRSLNVASAAAILMYEYSKQMYLGY